MTAPRVRMEPNGPCVVTGPITIADADGNVVHVEHSSLSPSVPVSSV